MKKLFLSLCLVVMLVLTACGTAPEPQIEYIVVTATPEPLPPTPKPDMEVVITECGYGEYGWMHIAGTITNNTDPMLFVKIVVGFVKNSLLIRTEEVYVVTRDIKDNSALLHGVQHRTAKGPIGTGETVEWDLAFTVMEQLTQPFECEASVTYYSDK